MCAALQGPLTFPAAAGPAPDSIIGILIFKYPTTANASNSIELFLSHFAGAEAKIFSSGKFKREAGWRQHTWTLVSFPVQIFGATFEVTFSSVGDPDWNAVNCLSSLITSSCHATLEPEQKRRLHKWKCSTSDVCAYVLVYMEYRWMQK